MEPADLIIVSVLSLLLPGVLIWSLVVRVREIRRLKRSIEAHMRDIRDFAEKVMLRSASSGLDVETAAELAENAGGLAKFSGFVRDLTFENALQLGTKRLDRVELLLRDVVDMLSSVVLMSIGDKDRSDVEWSVLVALGRLQARLEHMRAWPGMDIVNEGLWLYATGFVSILHGSDVDMTALAYSEEEIDRRIRASLETAGLFAEEERDEKVL